MNENRVSFDRFTKAVADLKLEDRSPRATAHTSSVVDFSNWDAVRREIEVTEAAAK